MTIYIFATDIYGKYINPMSESIFSYISATFGISAAIAIVVLGLAFWLTHYITKKVTEIKSSHNTLSESVGKMEKDIDEIRRDLSYLKGTIDIIKSPKKGEPLIQSNSPISLTEAGKKVAEELKADILIASNWDKISAMISGTGIDNAYDIQQYCLETSSVEPEKFFDGKSLLHIKDFAYKHGQPLQLYLRMLGVIIRDRYFKEKGVPLSKIDETAH